MVSVDKCKGEGCVCKSLRRKEIPFNPDRPLGRLIAGLREQRRFLPDGV